MLTTPSSLAGPPPDKDRPAQRRPASAVPSITSILLSPPGVRATLVDISASGLLSECGVPLKIGTPVKVMFEGTFAPKSVEARVVRTSVTSMMATGVRYHVAVVFNTPIALEDKPPPEKGADNNPAPVAVADPPPSSPIVNRW